MTHTSDFHREELDWSDCFIHHFKSNNSVQLRYQKCPHDTCLLFIWGSQIGVDYDTTFELVKINVEPLFQAFLQARNRAFLHGKELGVLEARAEMRKAIGVK